MVKRIGKGKVRALPAGEVQRQGENRLQSSMRLEQEGGSDIIFIIAIISTKQCFLCVYQGCQRREDR